MSNSQVRDDLDLLDLMLEDLDAAPDIYQTTNYWKVYEQRLIPYLRNRGLKDFRSGQYTDGGEVLRSFGASDDDDFEVPYGFGSKLAALPPVATLLRRSPLARDIQALAVRRMRRIASLGTSEEELLAKWRKVMYEEASRFGEESGAMPLSRLSASTVGGPRGIWQHGNAYYTFRLLYYYMRYAYVCRFYDFRHKATVVELSSGSGKQAEVLAQLHPQLTLCLFDIPPQLYVAHQYLSALLPERVVDYRSTRRTERATDLTPGMIYFFGNWRFDLLHEIRPELFWSAASFGEMEPHVVASYLRTVNAAADNVYLMQKMDGKERARAAGEPGVLEPTVFSHYRMGLPDFELLDRSPTSRPTGARMPGYEDSFWTRKALSMS